MNNLILSITTFLLPLALWPASYDGAIVPKWVVLYGGVTLGIWLLRRITNEAHKN